MTSMVVILTLSTALAGILMAVTPWIMPPTECFTVTVPPSAQQDARIRGFKRSFTCLVMGVCALCTVALGAYMSRFSQVENPTPEQLGAMSAAIMAATILPLATGMVLMLHYRAKVREIKHSMGWTTPQRRTASVAGEDTPAPVSLAWNLLYVPLVLGMAAFALSSYDRFPAQIPMHADFAGNVTEYAPKSLATVLFPALVTCYIGIALVISHISIIVSKRPIDPAAPASSALAYGQFARLTSIVLVFGGLALTACIGATYYLSVLGSISLGTAAAVVSLAALGFAFAMVGISVAMGQSGGRLAGELRASDGIASDDDSHWPLGVFYYNPEDPSVVVPKRFGVGWTLNMARPATWIALMGLVVVSVGFVLLINRSIS